MSDPKKHHYIPQFHLSSWKGPDGKVFIYKWVWKNLKTISASPKHTAYETDLYSIESSLSQEKSFLESEFLSPLDSTAAIIYRKMVGAAERSLTKDERSHWVRYMMALHTRDPETIRYMRDEGTRILTHQISMHPEYYDRVKEFGDPATLQELVELNFPIAFKNFGISHLRELVELPWVHKRILEMDWWIQELKETEMKFLISDRPLVLKPRADLTDPKCLIVLPLAPKIVFFATSDLDIKQELQELDHEILVEKVNDWEVRQAVFRVWGNNSDQIDFVSERLRKPDSPRVLGIF